MKYFTQEQINDIIKECNPNTIKYIYDTGEENNNPNLNKVIAAKFSKNELVFMCKKMTNKRGGARPGAGRPKGTGHAIKEDTAKRYTIRLTDKDLAIFKANGGIKTLRYLLNNNLFKSPD